MSPYDQISSIFEAVSAPARLQILLAIGTGEACVCHLEALLGMRQAYISQQLMVLREKELITARRDGKYIYYSLANLELLEVIYHAARLVGVQEDTLTTGDNRQCECPKCLPERITVEQVEIR